MLFGAALLLRGRVRVAALAAVALIVGPKILLLLPVWLMGVWVHRGMQAHALLARAGTVLALGSLLAYLVFRQLGGPHLLDAVTLRWLGRDAVAALGFSKWFLSSYVIGALVALHLVGIDAAAPSPLRALPERPIRYLASFTFALYLFHYPLLFFFAAWLEHGGLSAYRGTIVIPGTLATVWLLGGITERPKSTVRRWLAVGSEFLARQFSRDSCQGSALR